MPGCARRWASGRPSPAETAAELYVAVSEVMFAEVTGIVAAVLGALVVLRLTRMQNEKALRGPVPPGEPAPAAVRDHR